MPIYYLLIIQIDFKMWDELMKDTQKLNKINQTAFNVIDLNNDGAISRN